ncbi:MAG: IS21 family transposase [Cyclobacteriaceae bacterium]
MTVHLTKFIVYYDVHQLDRDDYSISQISKLLGINRRTVKKYLAMTEQEYGVLLNKQSERKKELQPYESFVRKRLENYPETSSAQMHDWLKEHHAEFPTVDPKTVYNFVHWAREKYNIPVVSIPRQYQVVEELPYGKQAQVDFGTYNMRSSSHSRMKVFFFVMTLSRSRYKFIWFSSRPFTGELAVQAHEMAFKYFGGVPHVIVYDQDKVFLVSENKGDLILTEVFRLYVRQQDFQLHFCRKADPESKGKVENVVKYVKQNFLINRTYFDDETLNDEAMGWLGRTANMLPHGTTKKEPFSEMSVEGPFLKPYEAYAIKIPPVTYTVRKDNTISWKGNLYSLPLGTYSGRGCLVAVKADQDELVILSPEGIQELCRHKIAIGKGIKIINTDHKRDKSAAIDELILNICNRFENIIAAKDWLCAIQSDKPRYVRDQLLIIRQVIETTEALVFNKAMIFCHQNKILSAVDFKAIADQQVKPLQTIDQEKIVRLNPLSGVKNKHLTEPEKSSIQDYEQLLKM